MVGQSEETQIKTSLRKRAGRIYRVLHFAVQQPAGLCKPGLATAHITFCPHGNVVELISRNCNYSVGNWKLDSNVREMMQLRNSDDLLWKNLIINTSPHIQDRLQEEVQLSLKIAT